MKRTLALASAGLVVFAALGASAQDAPAAQPAAAPVAPSGHIPPPPAGKAQVVFFRTGAYMGAATWYKVRENGAELGKLTNASYFVAVVDPGPHVFTASTENQTRLKLELDDGETQYVRATLQMGILMMEPNLAPVDQSMFELHYAHMHAAKPPKTDDNKPGS